MTAVAKPSDVPFLKTAAEVDDSQDYIRQAKQISTQIDAAIAQDKAQRAARKEAGDVSLLLLGQSESGKSTLLKQFQLMHSNSAFDEERITWKPVILLNILNTVRNVLHCIKEDKASASGGSQIEPELLRELERSFPELVSCEEKLIQILINAGHIQSSSTSKALYINRKHAREASRTSIDTRPKLTLSDADQTSLESIASLVESHKDNISAVWRDKRVQSIVTQRLQEDWRGYFMTHLPRITHPSYIPTDDDILHVRIMTMGVVEHVFRVQPPTTTMSFKKIASKDINMSIYDVGGARGQRHTWASYFDEATAIIFMAPISTFDQYLHEDANVNRIQDSLELFQKICDNPLLAKVELVLFLNKLDLLEQKLDSGITIKEFIPSYGDMPNDLRTAKKYFASHFQSIYTRSKVSEKSRRGLFIHFTSAVDTKTTHVVLGNVQDSILKTQLKEAKLM